MIHSAVQQFLSDVNWGPLDYLVFDMPPGTGDAQLSLSQVVPLSGVVMVTTPQDVALLDVRKALGMFQQAERADPRHRGEHELLRRARHRPPLRASSARAAASAWPTSSACRCSAQIPLEMETREGGDAGVPITVGQPDSAQAAGLPAIAAAAVARVDAVAALKLPSIG